MVWVVGGFLVLIFATLIAAWVQVFRLDDEQDSSNIPKGAFGSVAKTLYNTSSLQEVSKSQFFSGIREKVVASGAYGGSFESYLSMQFASMLIGSAMLLFVALGALDGILKIVALLFSVAVMGIPYNKATKNASIKAERTAAELPEFVEMLQIPLASGMSVEQALRFTIRFIDGPVSAEVQWLLDTMQSGTMNDGDAFVEAGRRLGTSEATAFFSTLGQSHIEGTRVSSTLEKQAESLRSQYHQVRRARIKKMPVTLIVAFAIHFLPFLFALVIVPLLAGLQSLG